MIQDIDPHIFYNVYKPGQAPAPDSILFCFEGEQILCREEEDGIAFPLVSDGGRIAHLQYLFAIDGQSFFLGYSDHLLAIAGFAYRPLRSLRKKDVLQKHIIFAAITARHLNDWYRSNRFCGRCGAPTRPDDFERALVCTSCGKIVYPRINPAVIVGVTHGENLLLTKYAGRNLPFYALIAGFAEIGESFEETVRREVMEEVGLHVKNIRYYKSQPWGFSADILAGYYCDVDGDPAIHMDTRELKEAVWMPRSDVPGQPDDFSLTNEMMVAFRDGLV